MPAYALACFGLIGTTVVDDGILERAYAEAIATQGVVTGTTAFARGMARVHRARGKSSIDVLREPVPRQRGPGAGRAPGLRAIPERGRAAIRRPARAGRGRGAR